MGLRSCELISLLLFRYLISTIASEIDSNCVIRPCVSVTTTGIIQNEGEKECIWCGDHEEEQLEQSELFALVDFAQSCAKSNAELERPRNNWCIGQRTTMTLFDSNEKIGCDENLITDPCSGYITQKSLSSSLKDIQWLEPWGGITCSKDGRHVRDISFSPKSKMECELGDFDLSPLTKLQKFNIARTGVSGNLLKAKWLLNLKQLRFLDLSRNKFTGSLNMLFDDQNLQQEVEDKDKGDGEVDVTTLEVEDKDKGDGEVDVTTLEADVECSGMCRLVILDLANNLFQGSIPHTLGSLPHLQHLRLNQNSFNGEIPTSLLTHEKLKKIDVRQNLDLIQAVQEEGASRLRM